MAISATNRLSLLPFPQRWEHAASTLHLRVLVLPRGNPLAPLITGVPGVSDGPAFADAAPSLTALLAPGLDALPAPAAVASETSLGTTAAADVRTLYEKLAEEFDIDPALEAEMREPRRAGRQILKYLPDSYRTAVPFAAPSTPFGVTDDRYHCALRDGCRLRTPDPPPSNKTVWGRIVAQALRQPLLAELLGLLYRVELPLAPGAMEDGGWLYLGLDAGSDYADAVAAQPDLLTAPAARIPALADDTDRVLFAPVLFPVASAPPPGDYDEIQLEAAAYDDGFTHVVHAAQKVTSDPTGLDTPGATRVVKDSGIQLGWDDEQLLIWQNRQISDPAADPRTAPLGVQGYRVDVRPHGGGTWTSLMRARADLAVGTADIGHFDGELTVEVAPAQLDNQEDGDYWMPVFFTQWTGRSLVTNDTLGLRLSGMSEEEAADTYEPVGAGKVKLRYGHEYDFRARLADLSGGGPAAGDAPVNPATAPVATLRFLRHLPPRAVPVEGMPEVVDPRDPPAELRVPRPKLAYPAALFADVPDAKARLLDDVAAIVADAAAGTISGGEPGLPDPDVATLRITVSAVGLSFDRGNSEESPPLRELYTAEHPFPSDPEEALALPLEYVDVADAETLSAPAAGDPLPIPTARDVVITLTPVGKEDPGLDYFGSQEARVGAETDVQLRSAPSSEANLLTLDSDAGRLRALLLRPGEAPTAPLLAKLKAEGRGVEAENDPVALMAAELGLHHDGAALSSRGPRRVVFGCSSALGHQIAPDGSIVTFSSQAELAGRWITVLTLELDRDWTWRNGGSPAFAVTRDGVRVGEIELPGAINPRVVETAEAAGAAPDRGTTLLVFFDAFDPKPTPPAFPHEASLEYTVTPGFVDTPGSAPAPLTVAIDLPIAAPPTQTPKIMGAGVALSPYLRAEDYSSTEPRERMLWLEFESAPENPGDGMFARVLSCAPDPMLTRGRTVDVPLEPPLPVNPEWVRVVHPGQSDDRAGLDAMQPLLPTASPTHFLLPLPPDLSHDSRELFGFFVYEVRVGHQSGWSTAQARFGPALRIAGVQHPAPQLTCTAMRTADGTLVAAPFATPVFNGRNLLPRSPATQIWFLLYAQVTQADGADHRNLLLGRRRGSFGHERRATASDRSASGRWSQAEIAGALDDYGLPSDSPLSVLAVELLPEVDPPEDPLGASLGEVRILRTSPLVKLSDVCVQPPCSAESDSPA